MNTVAQFHSFIAQRNADPKLIRTVPIRIKGNRLKLADAYLSDRWSSDLRHYPQPKWVSELDSTD